MPNNPDPGSTRLAAQKSTLIAVEWVVTRLGRLVPVGLIDPVMLNGMQVDRVGLNNITWIEERKLELGSPVLITRTGEHAVVLSALTDV